MKKSNMITIFKGILSSVLALFLVGSVISCGGSSTGPVQAPMALIQDFIAKHETMVDVSLANFYVTDEQPSVVAAIKKTIDEKKAAGELENLQNATFDFSNLQIAVVGEKEDYVDDQPTKLFKVSVSGSFMIQQENDSKTVQADETIIFAMVNNIWKVTEKVNPWS